MHKQNKKGIFLGTEMKRFSKPLPDPLVMCKFWHFSFFKRQSEAATSKIEIDGGTAKSIKGQYETQYDFSSEQ